MDNKTKIYKNKDILNEICTEEIIQKIKTGNIDSILDSIVDVILNNICKYRYEKEILEKSNNILKIENLKLKNDEIYNKINFLPNEIFLKIIKYLDFKTMLKSRLICKYWHDNISSISHKYLIIKEREDNLFLIKSFEEFCNKRIPFKEIIYYDFHEDYEFLFYELLNNLNFIGNIHYIDVNNDRGIYTSGNYNNKILNIFGDINIYHYLKDFNPYKIVISETLINNNIFRSIMNYCINQKRNIDLIFDNCVTFSFIKKTIELYNSKSHFIDRINSKNYNIINKNDETEITFYINHLYIKEQINNEYLSFIIKIVIYDSYNFKYNYKKKDEFIQNK